MRANVCYLLRAALLAPLTLTACGTWTSNDPAMDKARYIAARERCTADFPNSQTTQADCLTEAANRYIRPHYRYPDLMTVAQERRRSLAVLADARKISVAEYRKRLARSEAAISREEDRRNKEDTRLAEEHLSM